MSFFFSFLSGTSTKLHQLHVRKILKQAHSFVPGQQNRSLVLHIIITGYCAFRVYFYGQKKAVLILWRLSLERPLCCVIAAVSYERRIQSWRVNTTATYINICLAGLGNYAHRLYLLFVAIILQPDKHNRNK